MRHGFVGAIFVTRTITRKGVVLAGLYFVPRVRQDEEMINFNLFDLEAEPPVLKRGCTIETDLGFAAEHFVGRCEFYTSPDQAFTNDDAEIYGSTPALTMAYPVFANSDNEAEKILLTLSALEELESRDAEYRLNAIGKVVRFGTSREGDLIRGLIMGPRQLITELNLLITSAIVEARIPQVVPIDMSELDMLKSA